MVGKILLPCIGIFLVTILQTLLTDRCRGAVRREPSFQAISWTTKIFPGSASDVTILPINNCQITVYNNSRVESGLASGAGPCRPARIGRETGWEALGSANGRRVRRMMG